MLLGRSFSSEGSLPLGLMPFSGSAHHGLLGRLGHQDNANSIGRQGAGGERTALLLVGPSWTFSTISAPSNLLVILQ